MQVSKNAVVTMNYTLKNDSGDIIDSSDGAEPLTYIQGLGHIILGLEKEMEGKSKGDKFDVVVAPEEGYGVYRDELLETVPKAQFQDAGKLEIGMQFQVETEGGPVVVSIKSIDGDNVVVDGNHPLSGVTLHFNIEIIEIREASEEELSHGHVHSKGEQHH